MPSSRRVRVTFISSSRLSQSDAMGVLLGFRPERARLGVDRIEAWADLGPALTIPAVAGLGMVLRVLRAARIQVPDDPLALVGQEALVQELLERAMGVSLVLSVRPRTRISFTAWTESGVETVEDVAEVLEDEDDFVVMQRRARFPLRIPRASVVRRQTQRERWYEVLDIERAS